MRKLLGAAVIASLTLAPITAFACGDSMADYSAAEKLGLQAPPAATKAPATVAKVSVPKAAKPAASDAKAPAQDAKLKVASTQ